MEMPKVHKFKYNSIEHHTIHWRKQGQKYTENFDVHNNVINLCLSTNMLRFDKNQFFIRDLITKAFVFVLHVCTH